MSFWDIWNDPDFRREFDAIVDDIVVNGFTRDHTARLKKLEEESFKPISAEHQRHQARFARAPFVLESEEDERNMHGVVLWKQMQMAVRDQRERLAQQRGSQPAGRAGADGMP